MPAGCGLKTFLVILAVFATAVASNSASIATAGRMRANDICRCSPRTVYMNTTAWDRRRPVDGRLPQAEDVQRCLRNSATAGEVPVDHATQGNWLDLSPPADVHVCHTLSTMLLLPRASPARRARAASSALISAHADSTRSHLATILRSCTLWELVSLLSAVAWLVVCLAA
ncbi:hypothetical protein PYCCODRAFT_623888 [Trametes coccinea BRFM310]|uniref:Uncharacterized protein n=1 Tax=Trametes coccinea (strain BRFM310) TaxID=1353009 RepID=A0A1Y2J3T0_TRAC3|nr:hypothetical protein PYCCODRAFT_623888 [Trametes coccinea BRFM310]